MPQRLRPLESCLRQTGAVIVCALSTALVIPTHISSVGLPQTADFREIDVYAAGEHGYHTYRIPSVIATTKGTLLAFAEARRTSPQDAGDIDLVLRRSADAGATWGPMQVVLDNGPHAVNNPCPVVDRRTGAIVLIVTQNLGTDREEDILAGRSKGTPTVWSLRSADEGATWSAPQEITASVKRPDWTWIATGPGIGIQTRTGRLMIPANHAEGSTLSYRSHVFFSDDGARTWTLGGSSDAGTNESQVVELSDGRLMLNMRNHPPLAENFRLVATSADGGKTFAKAVADPVLIEPPAQASLLALSGQSRQRVLLFSNPASAKRQRLTVRLSEDEGASWPISRVVYEGHAAYSSLVELPGRSIGLLYERGTNSAYERLRFARFTLDWLRQGPRI